MSEAKFRVGQIVVMKSIKKEMPFRILFVETYDSDYFYGWSGKHAAAENMIREVRPDEITNPPSRLGDDA